MADLVGTLQAWRTKADAAPFATTLLITEAGVKVIAYRNGVSKIAVVGFDELEGGYSDDPVGDAVDQANGEIEAMIKARGMREYTD